MNSSHKREHADDMTQNLKGCVVREIQYIEGDGWNIIVEKEDHTVWSIYPFLTHNGPNAEIGLTAENLA